MARKSTGQVIDLAVCRVQLMKCKRKSLGVQGPQKQMLHLLLLYLANAFEEGYGFYSWGRDGLGTVF